MITPALRTPPADVSKNVTDEYVRAVNLNRRIITAAQLAQQSLYEMCSGFKEMRDSKLYKELGYTSFEEYCEKETGIKRAQAYSYIRVIEKLPLDFVQSTGQIGVQKLYLLSGLSEQERAEIADNTDLESATVRELEQQIKTLRAQKDKAIAEKSSAEAQLEGKDDTIEALTRTKKELESRICSLQGEIKELESRPIEVHSIPDNCVAKSAYEQMVSDYTAQIRDKDEEFVAEKRRAHAQMTELEKQLDEVKAQLAAASAAAPAEARTVSEQNSGKAVLKRIFAEVQNNFNDAAELIAALSADEKAKFTAAFRKLLSACGEMIEGIQR